MLTANLRKTSPVVSAIKDGPEMDSTASVRILCRLHESWLTNKSLAFADVNECFLENVCNGNARCQNTAGKWYCIDQWPAKISPYAILEPELRHFSGSYTCLCEPGFKSDGKQCVGKH